MKIRQGSAEVTTYSSQSNLYQESHQKVPEKAYLDYNIYKYRLIDRLHKKFFEKVTTKVAKF